MRRTFQSTNVPSVRIKSPPFGGIPSSSAIPPHAKIDHPISVDTFVFKNSNDFSLYIRQRHPGLVNSYALLL